MSKPSPLFAPTVIAGHRVPHRVVRAFMTRCRSTQPGDVPNAMNALYYAQRASAALIVTEATQVSPQGKGYSLSPGIHTDEQTSGWGPVADAVHAAGGHIFLQLWHVGRMSHPDFRNGELPVAPSAVPFEGQIWKVDPLTGRGEMVHCPTPRELSKGEIRGIVEDFRSGARRAIAAGLDGVEIHGANGYLVDQFLHTTANTRDDEYGSSRQNRLRFLKELVTAVAGEVGAGRTAIRLAPFLTARGMACPDILPTILAAASFAQGVGVPYLHLVEADWDDAPQFTECFRVDIRERFQRPIIVAGKYDLRRANWVLENGYADLVAFARPFVANPDLPRRLAEGLPLAAIAGKTLFGGGHHGYTDYPAWPRRVMTDASPSHREVHSLRMKEQRDGPLVRIGAFWDVGRGALMLARHHALVIVAEAELVGKTIAIRRRGVDLAVTPLPQSIIDRVICTENVRLDAETARLRLEEELRRSQKMAAIGILAGGIAHDFNNILGAILGYGEMAQGRAMDGRSIEAELDQVMQAGQRGKRLVDHILAFSRCAVAERVSVHVQSVVDEVLRLLAASLPPGVRLERDLRAGDTALLGDATQLHQVVMNLCTNAIQAMPHGGLLSVRLDRVTTTEPRTWSHGMLQPGEHIRLRVFDTGTGISRAVQERIFDPFFTTKSVGKGTGLGLSLVHGIVTDWQGAIELESGDGHGTTFTVWVPACGETAPPRTEEAPELPRGNGQSVLVVDDDLPLMRLAEETLAQLGYDPSGFHSSRAALEAFAADPDRYDLVLSDETMPELTGTQLAREIRKLRPDVPIMLMSGYPGAQLTAGAQAAGVTGILHKPLFSRDIAESLVRVLSDTSCALVRRKS